MFTLAIKTDQAEAYVALLGKDEVVRSESWEAMRTLSDQLLQKIESLLDAHASDWNQLSGIIVYKGPGSFTGLRIGVTIATTLAYALDIPVTGTTGEDWLTDGQKKLLYDPSCRSVSIEYGQEANITKPKK